MNDRRSTTKGFARTSGVLSEQIRRAGESRGFAVSRVLTHWAEIVGADIAAIARPVNVSYGKGGFGATLTVLTTGAQAPVLEMSKERIREKVNAVYGYNAIRRVRITQTAPTGFAEGQAEFAPKPEAAPKHRPEVSDEARRLAEGVTDEGLRSALERLARNAIVKREN